MGLAASQARLLTITSRQSDCEYQSMKYSHQKLELTRSMTDISNEYQNALDATKLVYDFYGTGDTSLDLSYGLMMTPSQLNGYMPTLLTDSSGKVVLSTAYAEAARYAGIPQEGLGCLPSQTMRDNFLYGLYASGLISHDTYTNCKEVEYSQEIGCGTKDLITTTTQSGTLDELVDYIKSTGDAYYTISETNYITTGNAKGHDAWPMMRVASYSSAGGLNYSDGTLDTADDNITFTLTDLLSGDTQYYLCYESIRGEESPVYGVATMQRYLTQGTDCFLDWLYDEFSALLNVDEVTEKALDYAYNKTKELLVDDTEQMEGNLSYTDYFVGGSGWTAGDGGKDLDESVQYSKTDGSHYIRRADGSKFKASDYLDEVGTKYSKGKSDKFNTDCITDSKDYIGFLFTAKNKDGGNDGNDHTTAAINLNNIAQAFLTYFAQYMEGTYNTSYSVAIGEISSNSKISLVTNDKDYVYTWITDTGLNADYALISGFYDALFNQLCTRGWVENNNIQDTAYMQEMLQSGKLYLATCSDDGYYYQGNYETNTYIKEVTDEDGIAKAEAKYNTEKLKIENKENIIDLKMKNLDTEISSLSTEYDTIKSLISKNIEKSFKRYDA